MGKTCFYKKSLLTYSLIIINEYGDWMLVISDSSTLILLARANILDQALAYFKGITIPKKVEKEVVEEGVRHGFADALLVRERIKEGKIKVAKTSVGVTARLQREYGLYGGEADALALYLHLKANLLGIDDGKAIKVCKILQIRFFTALSLAIQLIQEKVITKTEGPACLQELGKHGRYTKEELQMAFEQIGGGI